MNTRATAFLSATFVSTFGDILAITAIPFGVGLETGNINSTVIFWLIPALAVLGASFLGNRIRRRSATARTDYARLLLAIAAMEVVVAVFALQLRDGTSTLVLSILFVSVYAFAKEGIPRILYTVAMYRYFVRPDEYAKLAGRKAALDIAAALGAVLVASFVVAAGTWRYVLLFDAVTFVALALTIQRMGRDDLAAEVTVATPATRTPGTEPLPNPLRALRPGLISILIAVPLFHGVNAAFVNYLPLINEELGILSAATSIGLLAVLRAPGMLLGLAFGKLSARVSPRVWTVTLPTAYVLAALSYLVSPNIWSVYALLMLAGLNIGVYGPADATIRNQIPGDLLINFNVIVLRWLGVFQATAAVAAMVVFSSPGIDLRWLGVIVAAAVLGSVLLPVVHSRNVLLHKHPQVVSA